MRELGIAVQNVAGWLDLPVVAAALRCGAAGVLNLESIRDEGRALDAIRRLVSVRAGRSFFLKLDAAWDASARLLAGAPAEVTGVIAVPAAEDEKTQSLIRAALDLGRIVWIEAVNAGEAEMGAACGASAVVAKGHEAGGRIGEEGSFVLLQRLVAQTRLTVWVQGGVGANSAAACLAAGAAGVLLDSQLLLTPESAIPLSVRTALDAMEGEETVAPGGELGAPYRFFRRAGMPAADSLIRAARSATSAGEWRKALDGCISWTEPETAVWPLGQDAALAAPLAARFHNVAGIVRGIGEAARAGLEAAAQLAPLAPGSALAASHGLAYPIFQGPMTRVSDVAGFAGAVAENGALPFLALALLRASAVRKLLEETRRCAGDKPWGVGILGFVEPELRAEQLAEVRAVKPPFAIIAGGRPDQARSLEDEGIRTYLHVPAPSLLRMFIEDGARRFIFEGRECGGHVGPRTSFVLWESMAAVLLDAVAAGVPGSELHCIFAGGIHDARSAAMVSALAAPLVAQGIQVGVLMGTAYLFTREAVATGAIVEGFQQAALDCSHTVALESGPGHVTRCADTAFNEQFLSAKRRMVAEGKESGAIKDALENLNLGRLRLASKGVVRETDAEGRPVYRQASPDVQRAEGMYMIGQVAALRHEVCSMRELHESVSAGSVTALREAAGVPKTSSNGAGPSRAAQPLGIAIVGMSCLLPGAPDVRTFWRNVLAKKDAIIEIPATRFDVSRYFDQDKSARDKVYSRWGGFLDPVAFDPVRYGIPPASLGSIDPLQLLSLLAAERALEDAGYGSRQREFRRERASVILGLSGGLGDLGIDLALRSNLPQHLDGAPPALYDRLPEWTEDSFAGILLNVAAGRIANRLNLGGVNMAVDAACASALAAVYIAARELQAGTSDLVVVGGCDTVQSPFGFLCFSKSQALSPSGRCRPFDASADGIAISEGVAMLALKRVADAERDGDRIYAVIQGVAGSSDGRGRSMTAPRREGQVLAIRRAYEQAGFSAASVGLVEAHGTGTAAGDETEMASLTEVFAGDGAAAGSCVVGSVKSMVGHTKAAAGVTGLMKVALALHHRVLPPTLHVENPNPKLLEEGMPFHVLADAHRWPEPMGGSPRRAGVSSFGFGGTNFHAALEEYGGNPVSVADRCAARDWPAELFLWRADHAQALDSQLGGLIGQLQRGGLVEMAELAAAVNRRAGTGTGSCRLAIVAGSVAELSERIALTRSAVERGEGKLIDPRRGVYFSSQVTAAPALAFLFPGQGSQFPGMLREAALYLPEFGEMLDRADAALGADAVPSQRLSSVIYPPPAFNDNGRARQMEAITRTTVAQPALGVIELALCKAFERLGVRPAMAAGHSFGEYVALAAAGVMDEDDLFRIAARRGEAIEWAAREAGDAGTMAAVAASAAETGRVLNGEPDVVIANLNGPTQTIIAGATGAMRSATAKLEAAGLSVRPIPVACAFHSPLMQPAADRLAAALESLGLRPARIAVYSNTTAAPYPQGEGAAAEVRSLLARHLTEPVRFATEVEAMYDAGARVFVEMGPKTVLTGLVRRILDGRDAVIVSAASAGFESTLGALGHLFALGVPVRPDELCRGRVTRPVSVETLCEKRKPAGWYVSGARAYPASRPYVMQPPVAMPVAAPPAAVVPAVAAAVPALPQTHSPAPGSDAVMLEFQRMMAQFLESQTAVMAAYLGGDMPVGASPMPAPVMALPLPAAATPAAQPVPPPAPAAPVSVDVKGELLRIASERTGYPADLLHLDAGIEADLGIDSIKRVEILTALKRAVPVTAPMEQLTRARTFAEMLGLLQASAPPAPATPAPVSVDVKAELLRIASERTGYPVDLLHLDAGIEADLGIDSIKRVEILTALKRAVPVTAPMEQLTRARTLAEMLALLQTSVPAPASVDVKAELLRIASERTGYPVDLLHLDAGIEADLGIDSIKRVEILTALKRAVPVTAPMEQLTRARTFAEMLALLQTSSAPAAAAAPATPSVDVKTELLRIASERTGYPVDLLHLDAGIEADLGIDSIKRVEILTALKRGVPVTAPMEQLTRARTFAEMLALLQTSIPAPAAPAPVSVDVKAELLRIASERTGYPVDLLQLDAGIEADLGIDSIKRVEILTALKRAVPVIAPMEQLTRARTFADMLALLQPATSAAPKASIAIPRFRLALREVDRIQAAPRFHAGRVVVITDDESGLASRLASSLERGGERVVLLQHRTANGTPTESCVGADLTDEASVAAALDAVRRLQGPVGALIHLLPLHPDLKMLNLSQSLDAWRGQIRIAVRSLHLLVRTAQPDLEAAGADRALIAAVTARGGAFGIEYTPGVSPLQQMAADYVKSAAHELDGIACRVIDLDPADPAVVQHDNLLNEITAPENAPAQVGRPGDRRLTPVPQAAPVMETATVVGPGSVVVLTGGARGITAQVARSLAPRRATLILAGASALPSAGEPAETAGLTDPAAVKSVLLARLRAAQGNVRAVEVENAWQRLLRDREIRRTIEELRDAGATVEYHGLDVRDEAAMAAFIGGVYERHGKLDVFIHGAGIIEDKLIRDKTTASYDRVVETKAASIFLLARYLRPESLRALILMSSITAVFGNRGQTDYAAANGALNGLAAALGSLWPARVAALCWGPWDQGGMVTDDVRRQFLERGVQLLPPAEGAQAAIRDIENTGERDTIVVFGAGPWSQDVIAEAAAGQAAGEERATAAV